MTKKIFEKIWEGGVFYVSDLCPDEKKAVYAAMQKEGMSMSTSYLRFFDKGFDPWEIKGLTHICKKFLEDMDAQPCGMDVFWDKITEKQWGTKFCDYMATLGMRSQATVRNRFKANDWRSWELRGVRDIIDNITE